MTNILASVAFLSVILAANLYGRWWVPQVFVWTIALLGVLVGGALLFYGCPN